MKALLKNPTFHLFLLVGIAMTLPLYRSVLNGFIIISFLISIYFFFIRGRSLRLIFNPVLSILLLFYIYLFVNGLFGYNMSQLMRQLDKNLLFLIIPFSSLILFKVNNFYKILRLYTFSLSTITLALLITNLVKIGMGGNMSSLYFHQFTDLIGEHAVYFSLYLSFGILICLDLIQNQINTRINKLIIIIFSLGLWFGASKAIIILTVPLVFTFLYFIKILSFKKTALIFILVSIFSLSFFFNPYLKDRFVEGLSYNIEFEPVDKLEEAKVFSNSEIDSISDLELRVIFSKIALYHLIDDNKLIFGYGVSDYQDYLDYYYMYYGLAPFHYEGYSPHNQYVFTLVNSGLIGLSILLTYLVYSFYYAFRKKHYLYLSFLTLFCFSMLFETYLLRTKGIVFFFFFNSIFLIYNQQNENRNIRH
jgi:O-antigen ligase